MLNQIFTTKSHMTQTFIEGKRVPGTVLKVPSQVIIQLKTPDTNGYQAVQVAIGAKNKKPNKPQANHLKKANLQKAPYWTKEIRVESDELKVGDPLPVFDLLTPGDRVNATGTSLGKGFAGVMKRHGFAGGPRTHGQSDRGRAPGSVGRGTTPGRILPGKKMAGHMGAVTTTTKNLEILSVNPENQEILIKGSVPGYRGQLLRLTIVKKAK